MILSHSSRSYNHNWENNTMNLKRIVIGLLIIAVAAFLLIQLVPFGRNHTNPPVAQEPNWDSPETRALAEAACFDCHSNETNWDVWYANIAPVSWLVQNDVYEGREHLNFSEWGTRRRAERGEELVESVQNGYMPPAQYQWMHPAARLTDAQRQQLIRGLLATTAATTAQR